MTNTTDELNGVYAVLQQQQNWDQEPSTAVPDLAKLLHRGPQEQKAIQEREALRKERAAAELAALGNSGYTPNVPGKSAVQRAVEGFHRPAAQPSAPAKKPAMQRTVSTPARPSGAPITAMLSGNDFLTRAARSGRTLQRVAAYSHTCEASGCKNNAAWKLSGQYLCNSCVALRLPR